MKKFLFSLACFSVISSILLTSCSPKEEEQQKEQTNTNTEQPDVVLPVEDEVVEKFEYSFAKAGATLVAYNGEDEELILEAKPQRLRKKKEMVTVKEEVKNEDGTVSVVEKQEEQIVEYTEEYELIAIDPAVFMDNTTVKKIVIPDTVEEIGDGCFQNCTALEEIVLPAALKSIPDMAFHGCTSLAKLNVPENVEEIGVFAFGDYFVKTPWYDSLTAESVIVGDGILLKYNGYAQNVTYGEEVKKVAYYAFLESPVKTVTFTVAPKKIDTLATYRSNVVLSLPEGSDLVSSLKLAGLKIETH